MAGQDFWPKPPLAKAIEQLFETPGELRRLSENALADGDSRSARRFIEKLSLMLDAAEV
jgi:hypothetical protein